MIVVFLDIDGCLNRLSDAYSTPVRIINGIMTMVEPEIVALTNRLIERTNCDLVLSSSWRHSPDWRIAMALSGITKEFLDRTPLRSDHKKYGVRYPDLCRGHNVQDWLDENPVEKYAILDDASDFLEPQLPNLFKTDPAVGLTQEICNQIEKHFILK